jgi:predicted nucleic acid-binding Zn ribbon protein
MKTCPVCQTLVIGRSDKKYCSDDCRAAYHNERNRVRNKKIRSINRILRRNRNILGDLLQQDFDRVSKTHLQEKGFNFNYFTRERSEKGNGYKSCYDISYSLVEENQEQFVIIVPGAKK